MVYVIVAFIVVLLLAAFIVNLVRRATTTSGPAEGETPEASDAKESPRGPVASHDDATVARPVVGGEAEGERSVSR
jgi:hypothetical protein